MLGIIVMIYLVHFNNILQHNECRRMFRVRSNKVLRYWLMQSDPSNRLTSLGMFYDLF